VQSCRAGVGDADRADGVAALQPNALLDGDVKEVAIQAEVLRSMVEDHQIPESAKSARKRNRSVVNRDRRRILGRANLDPVAQRPRSQGRAAELADNGSGDGPVELAAERP